MESFKDQFLVHSYSLFVLIIKLCGDSFKGSSFFGWYKYVMYQQFFKRYEQKGQLWSKTSCQMVKGKQNFVKFRQNRAHSF